MEISPVDFNLASPLQLLEMQRLEQLRNATTLAEISTDPSRLRDVTRSLHAPERDQATEDRPRQSTGASQDLPREEFELNASRLLRLTSVAASDKPERDADAERPSGSADLKAAVSVAFQSVNLRADDLNLPLPRHSAEQPVFTLIDALVSDRRSDAGGPSFSAGSLDPQQAVTDVRAEADDDGPILPTVDFDAFVIKEAGERQDLDLRVENRNDERAEASFLAEERPLDALTPSQLQDETEPLNLGIRGALEAERESLSVPPRSFGVLEEPLLGLRNDRAQIEPTSRLQDSTTTGFIRIEDQKAEASQQLHKPEFELQSQRDSVQLVNTLDDNEVNQSLEDRFAARAATDRPDLFNIDDADVLKQREFTPLGAPPLGEPEQVDGQDFFSQTVVTSSDIRAFQTTPAPLGADELEALPENRGSIPDESKLQQRIILTLNELIHDQERFLVDYASKSAALVFFA